MSLHQIKLFAAVLAIAPLAWAADATAQTSSPAEPPGTAQPSITGALYQGLPGVWINQGKHLWFCQWQGNAAPRNERISCFGTELPAMPAR